MVAEIQTRLLPRVFGPQQYHNAQPFKQYRSEMYYNSTVKVGLDLVHFLTALKHLAD